ncbi:Hypothetical protein NTJ_14890 [Nesidiocoris tenuis]|uniref:ABC-type uncharacterized transport system domain-containing protein n=1 Tax=Nesidiocoris tenuis TaxID=355587 RepID=A0ABN7BCI0_9HEMI|nr:Hypothetical protein NTJ_14890 [Nesidiocoris tenuis]
MPPIEGPGAVHNYEKLIVFDQSKNEFFKTTDNYKSVHRKLKINYKVDINKEEITQGVLDDASVFIVATPKEKFTETEFNALKGFLDGGGAVLVTLGEGGEKSFETNINYLLEEYGIMINNDSVVRTHYYKYFHPKECLIPNGVLNRGIAKFVGKDSKKDFASCFSFVYPFGATLNTAKPAVPILSTGPASWPLNRPVCAFTTLTPTSKSKLGGRICVIGSGHVFSDKYIDKEENGTLLQIVMGFLTNPNELELNSLDVENPEISEYTVVADTCAVSERFRGCLMETTEDLPSDYLSLFNTESLYWASLSHVGRVISAYQELDVAHGSLKLAVPTFEESVPKLEPAVFPPRFLDLGPPALELYDLQEEFYSEVSRLSQTANKVLSSSLKNRDGDLDKRPQVEAELEDVEYFILECSQIVGLGNTTSVRSALWQMALHIANYKKNLHK